MKTFNQIEELIQENLSDGYETAIYGRNGKAVKYGSLVGEENELPDLPEYCSFKIWNNSNIDDTFTDYKLI